MALMTSSMDQQNVLTISIQGRFDYHSVSKFRYQYETQQAKPKAYVIDLTQTTTMDSTALGLLLHLRNMVGSEVSITIKKPNEIICKVLEVSQINRLFEIEH